MYRTGISTTFSAAHYLRDYGGKCEKLHGHNFRVEATVVSKTLDGAGMGLDFAVLREKTAAALAELDHVVLNELPAFEAQNPSSENLARHIYSLLEEAVNDSRVKLAGVRVWESDSSFAEYRP
jgi:6-pyruvoyltetrahydropterin/6-carboxytetrahydropterin synthase